jgi:hypothetical protein
MSRSGEGSEGGQADDVSGVVASDILPPHSPIQLDGGWLSPQFSPIVFDEDGNHGVIGEADTTAEGAEDDVPEAGAGVAADGEENTLEAVEEAIDAVEDFVPGTVVSAVTAQQLFTGLDRERNV